MKQENVFVAGYTGMVGSAICRKIQSLGNCNLILRTRKELDLLCQEKVYSFFGENPIDIVIISAARVGGINANMSYPAEFLYTNLQIQNNLFEASRLFGVSKIVFLGSSCIYPKNCEQPMKEEYLLTGPLEPTNEGYAIAKIAGIKMAQFYEQQYGIKSICVMPCNLYGKNDNFDPQHSHVLSALVKKFADAVTENKKSIIIWGTGLAEREFMNVDDLASAIIFLMEDWKGGAFNFINVGSGKSISIKNLAELIANKLNYRGEIKWDPTKPDGMLRKCLDISKITELGFFSSISLEDGIEAMINDYKKMIKGGFK